MQTLERLKQIGDEICAQFEDHRDVKLVVFESETIEGNDGDEQIDITYHYRFQAATLGSENDIWANGVINFGYDDSGYTSANGVFSLSIDGERILPEKYYLIDYDFDQDVWGGFYIDSL